MVFTAIKLITEMEFYGHNLSIAGRIKKSRQTRFAGWI